MKVREPVERPLDVVAVELLLSASQAFVAGTLMYLAVGLWADRGVGFGPVAFILAGLSLGVGAAWLFWLLGGTGWPLAAVSVPVALFAGVALVLGSTSDGLIRLEPVPLLLLIAASIYGIVGGVFVDSPRRWRWDQRQRLRAGTKVPKVSATTKALAAKLPRSMPSRSTATEPGWPEPPLDDADAPPGPALPGDATADRLDTVPSEPNHLVVASDTSPGGKTRAGEGESVEDDGGAIVPDGEGDTSAGPTAEEAHRSELDEILADVTIDKGPASDAPSSTKRPRSMPLDADAGGIELPRSLDPKSQRSPWAWAAPPDWTREEEDMDTGTDAGDER